VIRQWLVAPKLKSLLAAEARESNDK